MRRLGYVLVGLGVFLLVLAPLAKFFMTPALAKAPLDVYSESISEGTATTLFDVSQLKVLKDVPVVSTRITRGDVEASTDDRAVYDSFGRLEKKSDKSLITASQIRIPFERTSSIMVNCCGAETSGEPIEDFKALAPFKFPFFTEQKSYQYWDETLNKGVPARYAGEETVAGLSTYKFVMDIPDTKYAEIEVPGSLLGLDVASVKADRSYSNTRTVWIEPMTGAVIKGQEAQKQTFSAQGKKFVAVAAEVGFTKENIADSAKTAEEGMSQLKLISQTIPLVGLIGGIIFLVLGLFLIRRGGSKDEGSAHAA